MPFNFIKSIFSEQASTLDYSNYLGRKKHFAKTYPELSKLLIGENTQDVICNRNLDDPRFNTNIDNYIGGYEEMNWGYAGTGPWLLALNILYTFTGDDKFAQKHVFEFRDDFLMKNFRSSMRISAIDINGWIAAKKQGGTIVQ